jgi:hypothetical protein
MSDLDTTGLENPLLSDDVEVEETSIDDAAECTNDYFSNAYGQQYCVGDTIETADGPMTVTSIWEGQAVTDVYGGDLDADELYEGMGAEMGLSQEQFSEFIDSYNELKREANALDTSHHVLGPTEMESGRLGIRIRQENPDWTDEQVQAEVDRMLDPKNQTADAYADLAKREAELFGQYGMQSQNHATFGQGVFVNSEGKYFKFTGSNGHWQQTSQDAGFLDYAVPIGIAIGAAMIGGQVGSLVTGGFGAGAGAQTAAGVINNVIGSALSQAAVTGGIDPSSLLQAAIIGGIGGLADAAVDGVLPPSMDEAIWKLADQTGLDYAEIVDIAEGMATGAVTGDDLQSIVLGAAGNIGAAKAKDFISDYFGDTLNVDDLFKPGQSNIPIEALDPLIELGFQAAIEGGASTEDLLKAAFGYFSAGGDIDFLLPDTPEFDGFWKKVEDWIPGIDFEKGGWGIGYDEASGDIVINHDFPNLGIDLDFDLPDGVDLKIGNPCTTAAGQEGTLIGGALHGQWICDPTLPDVVECMEGFDWDGQQCVPIPDILPEGTDCEEGFAFDSLLGQCVKIGIDVPDAVECMEGWEWSDLYGECVEKIPDDVDVLECMEGYEWSDLYGECVQKIPDDVDVLECMEGWEWSDLYGKCVEKINDDIKIDGPDWNVGDPCSDEEGNEGFLNEAGLCDIQLPDLPPSSGNTAGAFTPTWGEMFAYTPFTPATGKTIADVDLGLLSEARKILG